MKAMVVFVALVLSVARVEADTDAMFEAIRHGDVAAVKQLVAEGEPVNPTGRESMFPILWAATFGDVAIAKLLLENGAMPDPLQDNAPLQSACMNGYAEIAAALIRHGADPNRVDPDSRDGMTCLMRAVSAGSPELVRVLLTNGADVSMRDKQGRTAMDISSDLRNRQEQIGAILDSEVQHNVGAPRR